MTVLTWKMPVPLSRNKVVVRLIVLMIETNAVDVRIVCVHAVSDSKHGSTRAATVRGFMIKLHSYCTCLVATASLGADDVQFPHNKAVRWRGKNAAITLK